MAVPRRDQPDHDDEPGLGTVVSGVGIISALQMASAVLGALPLVFVFLLAQRQIVEGVAGTGLK